MTNTSEPRTLSAVIGANIRHLREANRLTQDEAVRLLRRCGLRLAQSALVGIEGGTRSVAIGELIVFAHAFSVPVSDLMAGEGQVQLTAGATGDLGSVGSFFEGKTTPDDLDIDTPMTSETGDLIRAVKEVQKRNRKIWPAGTPTQIVAAERASDSQAERKAARLFGISPIALSIRAFRQWGTSLTDKRDAVVAERAAADASPRTIQAIRGRVTRELLAEIRQQKEED